MARKKGAVLESMLDMTHQYYRNQMLADISKKEIKTVMDKRTGQMRFIKKEGFDFEGCVIGGTSIAIEAKEAKDRLHLDPTNKRGLRLHQLKALLFRGSLGGLSGVIWMPSQTSAFLLDYSFLKNFYENIYNKTSKSISLKLAQEEGKQVMRGGMIDYLGELLGDMNGK